MPETIAQWAERLRGANRITGRFDLHIGDVRVRVASNSDELLDKLRHYFRHFRGPEGGEVDFVVEAYQADKPDFGVEYVDWVRDPGKTGRKDAYADAPDGRFVWKVRTGMQFLVGDGIHIAVGDCLANDNQVINFVNSQYIAGLVDAGWQLCHAAAVVHGGHAVAIAGFSGRGKSTLALHLLGHGLNYASNDRLLIAKQDGGVRLSGVAKFPRINPGTALSNPHLSNILTAERRAELEKMPVEQLWDLEEKYDVDIDAAFDDAEFILAAPMSAFVVLNWDRKTDAPLEFRRVNLREREDLLGVIVKAPGPFYIAPDGLDPDGRQIIDPKPYYDVLADIPIYEVRGRVDFDAAVDACMKLF